MFLISPIQRPREPLRRKVRAISEQISVRQKHQRRHKHQKVAQRRLAKDQAKYRRKEEGQCISSC